MKWIILKCGYEINWGHDPHSHELSFGNCVATSGKFRLSPEFFRLISAGFFSLRPFGLAFVSELFLRLGLAYCFGLLAEYNLEDTSWIPNHMRHWSWTKKRGDTSCCLFRVACVWFLAILDTDICFCDRGNGVFFFILFCTLFPSFSDSFMVEI